MKTPRPSKLAMASTVGFTLIEILVAIAIGSLLAVGIGTVLVNTATLQSTAFSISEIELIRHNMITAVTNDLAWKNTVTAGASSGSNPGSKMNCLVPSGMTCSIRYCTSDSTAAGTPITNQPFALYDSSNQLIFDATRPNNGLTPQGTLCSTFSNSGNDACPFRFDLRWSALCSSAGCSNPQIKVTAQLIYKPHNPSLTFNPQNYALAALYRISSPAAATGPWQLTTKANAPTARMSHQAFWTGSKYLAWGGTSTSSFMNGLNSGGLYDPTTDSWTPMALSPRSDSQASQAVWTGSQMITWGGLLLNPATSMPTEPMIYDLATNTWSLGTTLGAPSGRQNHSAVWTGTEMIVWGGRDFMNIYLNSGARYNPLTNTWAPVSTVGAPSPRQAHVAAWTGSKMIIWGGYNATTGYLNDGKIYDPATDTWSPAMSPLNAPSARAHVISVWTGTNLIVTRGVDGTPGGPSDGKIYDPSSDTWTTMVSGGPASQDNDSFAYMNGFLWEKWQKYNVATNTWSPISNCGAPTNTNNSKFVTTGSKLIIWGGRDGAWTAYDNGGVYDPTKDP